jgi:hypothetical protein
LYQLGEQMAEAFSWMSRVMRLTGISRKSALTLARLNISMVRSIRKPAGLPSLV